jgi:hypothetical protein
MASNRAKQLLAGFDGGYQAQLAEERRQKEEALREEALAAIEGARGDLAAMRGGTPSTAGMAETLAGLPVGARRVQYSGSEYGQQALQQAKPNVAALAGVKVPTGQTARDVLMGRGILDRYSQVPEAQAFAQNALAMERERRAQDEDAQATARWEQAITEMEADPNADRDMLAQLRLIGATKEGRSALGKVVGTREQYKGAMALEGVRGERQTASREDDQAFKEQQAKQKAADLKELEALRQQNRQALLTQRQMAAAARQASGGGGAAGGAGGAPQRKPMSAEAAKTLGLLASGVSGSQNLLSMLEAGQVNAWDVTAIGQFTNPSVKLAQQNAEEALGRLNSGGAISEEEGKRFQKQISNPLMLATEEGRMAVAENLRLFLSRARATGDAIYGGDGWMEQFDVSAPPAADAPVVKNWPADIPRATPAPTATPAAPRRPMAAPAPAAAPTMPRPRSSVSPTISPEPAPTIRFTRDANGRLIRSAQ